MNNKILIYSELQSGRTDYVFGYLFTNLLGLEMKSTSSKEEADIFSGPVVYYSKEVFDGKLCICPSGLLSETGYRNFKVEKAYWDGLIVLFPDKSSNRVPFDIFSASFWLMSRYEEYTEYSADIYGRFPAKESLAFKEGFLDLPIINLWVRKLAEVLTGIYPQLQIKKKEFHWFTTIDVDHAWAFLNKSPFRTLAGMTTSLFRARDFKERIRVLRGIEADPFYTFDTIRKLHQDFPEKLLIFFLSGRPGKYDLNISPSKAEWKTLVSDLGKEYVLGIHPSYRSNKGLGILESEFRTLSELLSYPLKNSRQHFLKITFPFTYRNLLEIGIQNDYSMGYPSQPGFRAGLCTPFNFYDLEREEKTSLVVWPITIMDRTLKDYLQKSPGESLEIIETYINKVEDAGGWFIPVWHNDSLSEYGEWKGWKDTYTGMLEILKSKKS